MVLARGGAGRILIVTPVIRGSCRPPVSSDALAVEGRVDRQGMWVFLGHSTVQKGFGFLRGSNSGHRERQSETLTAPLPHPQLLQCCLCLHKYITLPGIELHLPFFCRMSWGSLIKKPTLLKGVRKPTLLKGVRKPTLLERCKKAYTA